MQESDRQYFNVVFIHKINNSIEIALIFNLLILIFIAIS